MLGYHHPSANRAFYLNYSNYNTSNRTKLTKNKALNDFAISGFKLFKAISRREKIFRSKYAGISVKFVLVVVMRDEYTILETDSISLLRVQAHHSQRINKNERIPIPFERKLLSKGINFGTMAPPSNTQVNNDTCCELIILILFCFKRELASRALYIQVIHLPSTTAINKAMDLLFVERSLTIECLEKNPPKKRHPLILNSLIQAITEIVMLLPFIYLPCWLWELFKISSPILINNMDLKKACVIR